MKIFIIGSTQHEKKMLESKKYLEQSYGFEVHLPVFDKAAKNELDILERNLNNIKWADEIYIYWDCRSPGTWGDFCMAFALGKPVKIIYLEEKSMKKAIEQYCAKVKV